MNRREFISGVAAGVGSLTLPGLGAETAAKTPREIRAMYLRLGSLFRETAPWDPDGRFYGPKTEIFWESLDKRVAKMAECGLNVVLLELMEGLRLKTVGKAVPDGAATPKELNAHIRAWKKLGVRTVPLVNFSIVHAGWMGFPSRMASSTPYQAFCRDVIAEVHEVLEKPPFIHVGFDGELPKGVLNWKAHDFRPSLLQCRQKEVLWKDVRTVLDAVEKTGAHAWMWSIADREGFVRNVPKTVFVSPVYTGNTWEPSHQNFDKENRPSLEKLLALAEDGYRLVPCGLLNTQEWFIGGRRPSTIDRRKNPAVMIGYTRPRLAAPKLAGFVTRLEVAPGAPGDKVFCEGCECLRQAFENPTTVADLPAKEGLS